MRGLVRCATCGGACTGHNSHSRGKRYHYYACRAAKTYNFGVAPPHKASFVSAEWLEDLVWSDVRRFLKNPGAILERLREEHDAADDAGDLEARKKGLAKRLAAKQAEKDRYVRAYAQGHISEEELKKPEDGRTEVRITYRFGPPPASGSAGSPSQGGMFVSGLKNGSRS
jgi:hypothetical protein